MRSARLCRASRAKSFPAPAQRHSAAWRLARARARTFEIYVYFASPPANGWQNAFSASDSAGGGSLPITLATGAAPQLGGDWYDLGSVSLLASDSSSSVVVSCSSGSPQQIALVGYGDQNYYNGAGELAESVDRDGRAIVYSYNALGEETSETWYAAAGSNGAPQGPATETLSFAYDDDGRELSASDTIAGGTTATDSYTYDAQGDVLTESEQIPGLTPTVTLTSQYADGNRTQLAAAIGATNDFVNSYQYNGFEGQMSQVSQTGNTNGGDSVAAKTATFQYDLAGELAGVGRYQNSSATPSTLVAQATYGYDGDANLTSIDYADGDGNRLVNFGWTYDAAGNVLTSSSSLDGKVTYTNDSDGELLSAGGSSSPSGDQSFSYDANGNRQTVTTGGSGTSDYQTGPNNEVLFDGMYNYEYDAEGNRIARWVDNNGVGRVRRSRATPTSPSTPGTIATA